VGGKELGHTEGTDAVVAENLQKRKKYPLKTRQMTAFLSPKRCVTKIQISSNDCFLFPKSVETKAMSI